jgi:hypothetical protein
MAAVVTTLTINNEIITNPTMNDEIICDLLQQCHSNHDMHQCVFDYINRNSVLLKAMLYNKKTFPNNRFIELLWTTLYYVHNMNFSNKDLVILNHFFHLFENEFAITGIINIKINTNPHLHTVVSADHVFFSNFMYNTHYLQLSNSLLVFYIQHIIETKQASLPHTTNAPPQVCHYRDCKRQNPIHKRLCHVGKSHNHSRSRNRSRSPHRRSRNRSRSRSPHSRNRNRSRSHRKKLKSSTHRNRR